MIILQTFISLTGLMCGIIGGLKFALELKSEEGRHKRMIKAAVLSMTGIACFIILWR